MNKHGSILEGLQKVHEGKQVGIIYHYTDFSGFDGILKNGLVIKDRLKRGYISFTRIGGGLALNNVGLYRFVVDGDTLSDKYKVVPDSLARVPGGSDIVRKDDGTPYYKNSKQKQAEERVYADEIDLKPFLIKVQLILVIDIGMKEVEEYRKLYPNIEVVKKFTPYKG